MAGGEMNFRKFSGAIVLILSLAMSGVIVPNSADVAVAAPSCSKQYKALSNKIKENTNSSTKLKLANDTQTKYLSCLKAGSKKISNTVAKKCQPNLQALSASFRLELSGKKSLNGTQYQALGDFEFCIDRLEVSELAPASSASSCKAYDAGISLAKKKKDASAQKQIQVAKTECLNAASALAQVAACPGEEGPCEQILSLAKPIVDPTPLTLPGMLISIASNGKVILSFETLTPDICEVSPNGILRLPIDEDAQVSLETFGGSCLVSVESEETDAYEADSMTVSINVLPIDGGRTLSLTPAPTITELPMVGRELRADGGNWETGAILSYQWKLDGSDLPGEITNSITPSPTMAGKVLSVAVTGTKRGYKSVTVYSRSAQVRLAKFDAIPIVSISGEAKVGQELTSTIQGQGSEMNFEFTWKRNGSLIAGAKSSKYTLSKADVGKQISLSVQISSPGFESVTIESLETSRVVDALLTLTPVPKILGKLTVGSILQMDSGTWNEGVVLSQQWFRNSVAIPGATSTNYELTAADLAKSISLEVTGSKQGYTSTLRASSNYGPIAEGDIGQPISPIILGETTVGSVLEIDKGDWPDGVNFSFRWFRGAAVISGATSSTYTLVSSDNGNAIKVEVAVKRLGYKTLTLLSSPTIAVSLPEFTNQPAPIISGFPIVGQILRVLVGQWDVGTSLSVQWLASGVAISGATSTTFTPSSAQVGKEVSVRVTGSKTGFKTSIQVSDPTEAVATGTISPAPTPTISGPIKLDSTLTSNLGTWPSGVSLSRQWLRDGVAIVGATAATYVLKSADVGAMISIRSTATKSGYQATVTTSTEVGPVLSDSLEAVSSPVVTGDAMAGQVLTMSVADPSRLLLGASVTYEWLRGSTLVKTGSTTYTTSLSDVGSTITARIKVSKAGAVAIAKSSQPYGPITPPVIAKSSTPVVSGTPNVGNTLTATVGTWSSNAALSFQWYRGTAAISGATMNLYSLTSADAGKTISFRVTGSYLGATQIQQSVPITISTGTFGKVPTPIIFGSSSVGSTLSLIPGSWSPAPSLTYSWLRDGVVVSGRTSTTYLLSAADLGKSIVAKVQGSLAGYTTVSMSSAAVLITEGSISPVGTPAISGSKIVGTTLSGFTGTWMSGTALSYEWIRNGTVVKSNSLNYLTGLEDSGQIITLRVTGNVTGYLSVVREVSFAVGSLPAAPVIGDVFSKLSSLEIPWSGSPQMSNIWEVVNSSGAVVSTSACGSSCPNPVVLGGLSPGVSYTVRVTTSSSGGSMVTTKAVSTYPVLTLQTSLATFGRYGDQLEATIGSQPGWRYRIGPGYGCTSTYSSSNWQTGDSIKWLTTLATTACSFTLYMEDGHGNASSQGLPKAGTFNGVLGQIAPPEIFNTSLDASNSDWVRIGFSSSTLARTSMTLTVVDSAGNPVSLTAKPTINQTSGDLWNGSFSSVVSTLGLPAGDYTISVKVSVDSSLFTVYTFDKFSVG